VTSKLRFKEFIKKKVEMKAFEYLLKLKDSHSKSKNIKHEKLHLQPCLRSQTKNLSINDKKFIFAARTRMLDLKGNFKTGKLDEKCRKCEKSDETQENLLECSALWWYQTLPTSLPWRHREGGWHEYQYGQLLLSEH
jgi:hypothetical protein